MQAIGRLAAESVRDLGAALAAAKADCRHGEWLPFLAAAGLPERFAQRAIRYSRLVPKSDNLSDLPAPSKLLCEAATPTTAPTYLVDGRRVKAHPVADFFPLLSDSDMAYMRETVRRFGCVEPVLMRGDVLLDGRIRALACEAEGIPVPWREAPAVDDVRLIVAANVFRQHLTEDQRAIAAARLASVGKTDLRRIGKAVHGGRLDNLQQQR